MSKWKVITASAAPLISVVILVTGCKTGCETKIGHAMCTAGDTPSAPPAAPAPKGIWNCFQAPGGWNCKKKGVDATLFPTNPNN